MRVVPHLCALGAGVAAALAVGCGGDRSGLLPPANATSVRGELDAVKAAVADGDCGDTTSAIDRARRAVRSAPDLDPKLRSNLLAGLGTLAGRATTECEPAETQPDTTTTEIPTTETTAPETTSAETEPTTPSETDPATPADPADPGTDPEDPSGGGLSPEAPTAPDPGTADPGTGGADPSDPTGSGSGEDPGFRGAGRDRGAAEGYLP